MKTWKRLSVMIGVAFLVLMTGCYTVVMVPRRSVERLISVEAEDEEVLEEGEEYSEEYAEDVEDATIVNKYYVYGDLWGGYLGFDPIWSYPGSWRYSSWGGWGWSMWDPWYDPWTWGVWSPYGYYPYGSWGWYGYRPWGYGGWGGWVDPYWAYWDGYYGAEPTKRQPFDRREPFHERDGGGGAPVSVSDGSGTPVSKGGDTARPDNLRRDRKQGIESATDTESTTPSGSTDTGRRERKVKNQAGSATGTERNRPSESVPIGRRERKVKDQVGSGTERTTTREYRVRRSDSVDRQKSRTYRESGSSERKVRDSGSNSNRSYSSPSSSSSRSSGSSAPRSSSSSGSSGSSSSSKSSSSGSSNRTRK
jgi:hypothetical protein